ncbi:MAG: sigma-70 family RNA polymerase sigma factor [Planctomycetota bacterium]|nr:sigma-70 family RNA polymerase sigma factor [Planctomycetota bacterium]
MTTRAPESTQLENQNFSPERRWSFCEDLYQQHSAVVFGYLCKLTTTAQEAEDVLQETFLRLFNRADQIDPDRNVRALIFQIARNLTIDRFRSRQSSKRLEAAVAPRATVESGRISLTNKDQSSPQSSAEQKERLALVNEVMTEMDLEERSILLLFSKGFNHTELAEVLSVSRPTAKKRLTSAIAQFQRALAVRQINEGGDL